MDTSSTGEYEPSEGEEIKNVQNGGSVAKVLPEHRNSSNAGQSGKLLSGEQRVPSTETGNRKPIRKAEGNAGSQSKLSKVQPIPAYHALLDEIAQENTLEGKTDDRMHLRSSQVGLTFWSSKEKEIFFSVLTRRGKNDLQGIARAIGSKSEPEVHVYMQLLHQEVSQFGNECQPQFISIADLPAASEISKDTTALLNGAAESLRSEETELRERLEKEIFGDFWLLNYKFASIYDQKTVEDKPATFLNDIPDLQRSMQLLDLYSFLELSLRFFMNSHKPKENWRAYAEDGETPSLYASAFVAFHDLVLDITKRLISSTVFLAMSRLRDKTSMQYVKQHGLGGFARKDDVLAAVNLLGLKPNKQKFWIGVAQRCNLEVYKEVTRRGVGLHEPLSFAEVEKDLMESRSRTSSVAKSPVKSETISAKTKNSSLQNNDLQSDGDDTSNLSDSLESTSSDAYEKEQELYAESLDHDASRQEDQRLMDVLKNKKRLLHHIGTEDTTRAKRPKIDTIRDTSPVDWRNWLKYQSPWERYKSPVPEADFAKNQTLNSSKRVSPIPLQESKAPLRKTQRSRQPTQPKSKEFTLAEDEIDNSEEMGNISEKTAINVDVNNEDDNTKEVIQSFSNDTANRDADEPSHDHEMKDTEDEHDVHDVNVKCSRHGPMKSAVSEDESATRDKDNRHDALVERRLDSKARGRTGYQQQHSLSNTEDEESDGESEDVFETDSTDEDDDDDDEDEEDA